MGRVAVFVVPFLILLLSCGRGQSQSEARELVVGGAFENRDFMYIDMPDQIDAVDTSAAWGESNDRILIAGTVFKSDGQAPAPDVTLYYYHTDDKGIYADREGLNPRARRHGYIRGWVKTGPDGKYAIHTARPAPYPTWTEPAHVHVTIKEPGMIPYWIDAFVFEDDKFVTAEYRKSQGNRGGSGILTLANGGTHQVAIHDIVLGLNIPDHPGHF